jgi:hypothetical protein
MIPARHPAHGRHQLANLLREHAHGLATAPI